MKDARRCSNVYVVKPWLWQFGLGKPRLVGLTVEETAARKETVLKKPTKRGQETDQRRKADQA